MFARRARIQAQNRRVQAPDTASREALREAVLAGPKGLAVARFALGPDEFAWLSFELPEVALPKNLTPAEADVARAVLEGKSNQEIATQRGVSLRTIANQLQTIFRKVGVRSRWELIHVCGGSDEVPG